jgi:hypothetical protein
MTLSYIKAIPPSLGEVIVTPYCTTPNLIEALKEDNIISFIQIRSQETLPPEYTLDRNGLLLFKGRLCVNRLTPLYTHLI